MNEGFVDCGRFGEAAATRRKKVAAVHSEVIMQGDALVHVSADDDTRAHATSG